MAWFFSPRKCHEPTSEPTEQDAWSRHIAKLAKRGIAGPGGWHNKPVTEADDTRFYDVAPSFVERLPWVEFLPQSKCMLLEDGVSVAAFFELMPLGTEGRETAWLLQARDTLENVLQDCFDELDSNPWVVQLYAQDETNWDAYLNTLGQYLRPRARDSAFSDFYLRFFAHHLKAIAKPGGLFEDTTLTRLRWKGQNRRVRMVVYRRASVATSRKGHSAEQALSNVCDRLTAGLSSAGLKTQRLEAKDIYDWLLRWFNPSPTLLGGAASDRDRFYQLTAYPEETDPGEVELASGTDFSQRLFFSQPHSDAAHGTWFFNGMPHRVMLMDRMRSVPHTGHLTGETRKGDAINSYFDQMPEDTMMCLTLVATPQDVLEAHLNHLSKKSVGDTLASEQTRQDVQQARSIIGSAHKLYRGSLAFFLRGKDIAELDARGLQLANVMLNAGLQPVREDDEVAPLNSYLRWLPCVFDPAKDKRQWYSQLMFAQHAANLAPVWGRSQGTGHPGITFFNRGGGTLSFDPLNRLDRQMNAHLFLFGPTGSGKSATLNNILNQITAIYRPRLFIVEAGNSFGLFAEFAKRLGLTVHHVKLSPGAGVSLAPFADARRLIETPEEIETLDAERLEATVAPQEGDEQRDVLGELEITARLMITGGEDKEEARLTRADRSLIRQSILDAAQRCADEHRSVLTQDVRDALRERGRDNGLPESRRTRLLEMAEAMDLFCQGLDGELFNRPGTPWPEADITIVDLATFAREGYNAQLSIAYLSLLNTVNNIAERDQFQGRPIINVTDEGHIITKNPLLSPYVVKITKMWRKLGAWFWLATQNLDDLPKAAEPMLNMIEWWICLSMPPDEVEKIARFRELSPAQKSMMMSARKEAGKYCEGVVLSKSMEALFRAVPPSLYLAMAMTEPEEKAARFKLMQEHGISELDAAIRMAENIDRARGIQPLQFHSDG
ncbi:MULTISPECIES: conjugative transfer ATPase [unclassified Pseudomonas]|uniref:conjugative transfer ATPase n=1 Tax=unclassified Pseudomonas TaxID=196821 RepID=UPI000876BFD1|nr:MULTISPECIES: conjugative transfer ATPase [unclassified Pseudomonas]SCZ40081.1 conjugative transfer ATPase, PFL_4706 family [Pseudomonas sp. NFACC44-2]SDA89945.1 conjugative transfer ATPase, PFL_4706 family [Pseudomonas sp. NFACC51]SDW41318.1 conjugative transfer ATPase, PFL_4706 family [Pseudomonas sp. NFACC08-1]SFI18021.1 conjugative transfer ATPase, PFL_4706 family [Pseudomonas sp. NFACC54]SFT28536.1 conjugative transfer ATPase, PFL_4706 family [Pseudomonas sp. NFACC48-1]